MTNTTPFADALESADRLSLEEQETLVAILRRRIAEAERRRLVEEIRGADPEVEQGKCRANDP